MPAAAGVQPAKSRGSQAGSGLRRTLTMASWLEQSAACTASSNSVRGAPADSLGRAGAEGGGACQLVAPMSVQLATPFGSIAGGHEPRCGPGQERNWQAVGLDLVAAEAGRGEWRARSQRWRAFSTVAAHIPAMGEKGEDF